MIKKFLIQLEGDANTRWPADAILTDAIGQATRQQIKYVTDGSIPAVHVTREEVRKNQNVFPKGRWTKAPWRT